MIQNIEKRQYFAHLMNLPEGAVEMMVERVCFGSCARQEVEKWTGKYAKGSMELKAEGRVLEGTWKDGDRGGKCRFELTRDGMNMLGRSGRGDGPVLLNWSGWREAK